MAREIRDFGPILNFRRRWVTLSLLWEPRDLWLGVYVAKSDRSLSDATGGIIRAETRDVFVCPLPTLVFRFTLWRSLSVVYPFTESRDSYFDLPAVRNIEMSVATDDERAGGSYTKPGETVVHWSGPVSDMPADAGGLHHVWTDPDTGETSEIRGGTPRPNSIDVTMPGGQEIADALAGELGAAGKIRVETTPDPTVPPSYLEGKLVVVTDAGERETFVPGFVRFEVE